MSTILYVRALSPLHAGVGQTDDVIDLPVAREGTTRWPIVPGSQLKGVLRDHFDPGAAAPIEERKRHDAIFGPPTNRANEAAGSIWFHDARLLCFPVRSFFGSFAWLTCPLALRRWGTQRRLAGLPGTSVSESVDDTSVLVTQADSALLRGVAPSPVYLEDLTLNATVSASLATVADELAEAVFQGADAEWRPFFTERLALVHDDVFSFLAETATEVIARIRLDDKTKTVVDGALWYEEMVPAETILSAQIDVAPNRRDGDALVDHLAGGLDLPVQVGGKASVGRGLVQLRMGARAAAEVAR